jgi:hypothetical protein
MVDDSWICPRFGIGENVSYVHFGHAQVSATTAGTMQEMVVPRPGLLATTSVSLSHLMRKRADSRPM